MERECADIIIMNVPPKETPAAPSRAGMGGPKTAEGKAISCRNALKHGMRAEKLGLDDAQREDFAALWQQVQEEYQPDGPTEETLVREMWRHACFLRIIAEGEASAGWYIYQRIVGDTGAQDAFGEARARRMSIEADCLQLATRYRAAHERGFHAAYRALMMHRALVHENAAPPMVAKDEKVPNELHTRYGGEHCPADQEKGIAPFSFAEGWTHREARATRRRSKAIDPQSPRSCSGCRWSPLRPPRQASRVASG